MLRRVGRPGLIGTVARTAVIAGTATATSNAVNRHSQAKAQQAQEAAGGPGLRSPASSPPTAGSCAGTGTGTGRGTGIGRR